MAGKGTFRLNIQANLDAMTSNSRFLDIGENETKVFRFAPPVVESGLIFYRTFNHYKLKNEEGRGIALADLRHHGTDETGREDYIAELSEALQAHGDDGMAKIGKAIKGNNRYYAQGWELYPQQEGGFKYGRLVLMSLPKTAAEGVMRIFKNQELMSQPNATDPESGQAILVTREGTGFNTKYSAERSGDQVSLADVVPDWEKRLYADVYDALKLNVYTREEQKKIAQITYPELDWDMLEKEYSL